MKTNMHPLAVELHRRVIVTQTFAMASSIKPAIEQKRFFRHKNKGLTFMVRRVPEECLFFIKTKDV